MKHKACKKCAASVGTVNILGNILMILIKGYLGVVGRSKGLIADAIHSSADLLATIVMIIGLRISDQEEDEKYPYGYGMAEYLVGIVIYLFLFVIACYIIYNGVVVIMSGREIKPCLSAAWGAIFSIIVNELMFRQSICAGTQINSHSMVAKAWESRSDVYSSIAVLIGIVGSKMGFHFMDPLAAIIVGVIILKICIEMVADSISKLMDQAPDEDVLEAAHKALTGLKNVVGIKNVHAREIGRSVEFKIELNVPAKMSVSQGEAIKREAKKVMADLMERKSIVRVMLCPVDELVKT
ncbi:MAG TPA: cation diffusion facilitator family transporter [Anaerolineae bacterium]|nr:cation diffusion facilitator family transporter [Anaerolineae bacterium]